MIGFFFQTRNSQFILPDQIKNSKVYEDGLKWIQKNKASHVSGVMP